MEYSSRLEFVLQIISEILISNTFVTKKLFYRRQVIPTFETLLKIYSVCQNYSLSF